jgi:hypothetical protein
MEPERRSLMFRLYTVAMDGRSTELDATKSRFSPCVGHLVMLKKSVSTKA